MIRAIFFTGERGDLLGFSVEGHAGLADAGSDILCAAVSSAAYMAANTLLEILRVTPKTLSVHEGNMRLVLEGRDTRACETVLSGLKLHFLGLEEQYPENLNVSYAEVETK